MVEHACDPTPSIAQTMLAGTLGQKASLAFILMQVKVVSVFYRLESGLPVFNDWIALKEAAERIRRKLGRPLNSRDMAGLKQELYKMGEIYGILALMTSAMFPAGRGKRLHFFPMSFPMVPYFLMPLPLWDIPEDPSTDSSWPSVVDSEPIRYQVLSPLIGNADQN